MMDKLYTASAQAIGGRKGHVRTADGVLDFDLSLPKSMGGDERAGTTNPEQLFACGYAACFGSALDFVAQQKKIELKTIDVRAAVSIGRTDKGFLLAVELIVSLPGLTQDQAQELTEQAHLVCPYSNATRNNIEVKLTANRGLEQFNIE